MVGKKLFFCHKCKQGQLPNFCVTDAWEMKDEQEQSQETKEAPQCLLLPSLYKMSSCSLYFLIPISRVTLFLFHFPLPLHIMLSFKTSLLVVLFQMFQYSAGFLAECFKPVIYDS